MEENPFLVSKLVTQKCNLTGALVAYISKTLESNPQEFQKYNLTIQRFQDVLIMVMPIVDTICEEGKIAFRFFVINNGEAIDCHLGLHHKPYGKVKIYDTELNLMKGDAYFTDAQIIQKKSINNLYFIFGTQKTKRNLLALCIGGSIRQKAVADQYIEFHIPITKILKPDSFVALKETQFYGLANKNYVDKNGISHILYAQENFAVDSYTTNIMAISCLLCCFGIGLLFIPVAILLNKRKKKLSLKYQSKLFIDKASILNPPPEWLAAMDELSK